MIGIRNENSEDRLAVLKLFLSNGQEINAVGSSGQSILITSVMYKHRESIQYLLENTAIDSSLKLTEDNSSQNPFKRAPGFRGVEAYKGETSIDIARREKMDDIVAMLGEVTISQVPNEKAHPSLSKKLEVFIIIPNFVLFHLLL